MNGEIKMLTENDTLTIVLKMKKIIYLSFKRIFDVLASILGLILLIPVTIFIKIAYMLTGDFTRIFFVQERIGKDGKLFKFYKFRSMVQQRPEDEKKGWTTKNDSRVTKVGSFIIKTSIDELPQLFNIFVGQMSLVGPRPERPQFVEKFREEIPRYMIKHQVRPGMTGWAQINGYRGDTSISKYRLSSSAMVSKSITTWHPSGLIWYTYKY